MNEPCNRREFLVRAAGRGAAAAGLSRAEAVPTPAKTPEVPDQR